MNKLATTLGAVLLTLLNLCGAARAADTKPDPFAPLARLLGDWTGVSSGAPTASSLCCSKYLSSRSLG